MMGDTVQEIAFLSLSQIGAHYGGDMHVWPHSCQGHLPVDEVPGGMASKYLSIAGRPHTRAPAKHGAGEWLDER